jgi:polynucleotide 5'-kinase involved in rRNA processing
MLGCTVRAAWRSDDELVLVVEGYAYSLGTLKVSLGVRQIHLYNWYELEGLLVGCVYGGEFCGLGLLKGLTAQEVVVWTPVERASVLQLGGLRLDERGRHERVRLSI